MITFTFHTLWRAVTFVFNGDTHKLPVVLLPSPSSAGTYRRGELGVDDIQNLISPYCSNTATDDIIVVQTALGDGLMTTCSITEISLLAIFPILASCSCTLFLSRPTRGFISDWTLFRSRTSRLPDDVDFLRSG